MVFGRASFISILNYIILYLEIHKYILFYGLTIMIIECNKREYNIQILLFCIKLISSHLGIISSLQLTNFQMLVTGRDTQFSNFPCSTCAFRPPLVNLVNSATHQVQVHHLSIGTQWHSLSDGHCAILRPRYALEPDLLQLSPHPSSRLFPNRSRAQFRFVG